MQASSQRTRAQELDVWSALIRNLAHEVNNTVAPIKSMAQSLVSSGDERARRSAELIEERAQALADFVARCSEIARVPMKSVRSGRCSR